MNRRLLSGSLCVLTGLALTGPAVAGIVEDFAGPAAGTVIAGTTPFGPVAPGTTFPGYTLSVINSGGGPQSLIIFDSSNPTGEDPDLGSPNETCGGPGVGVGGEVGQPGENCVAQGNLLIVAEDIVDANTDNIVDDPDDEAGGGTIIFEFDTQVDLVSITIMDIDNETAAVSTNSDTLMVTVNATDEGDNSAQTLDLSENGGITCMAVTFSSSGAVAGFEYEVPVSVESRSWGAVKTDFR